MQRGPLLWFCHFHAIPELREALIEGRQATYFRWFLQNVSADPAARCLACSKKCGRSIATRRAELPAKCCNTFASSSRGRSASQWAIPRYQH